MKRFLSLTLSVVMFLSLTSGLDISAYAATYCTNNNNHTMDCGELGRWFNSLQELHEFIISDESLGGKWAKKLENDEISYATYNLNAPGGYECWSCANCKKWTGNYKYRYTTSLSTTATYYNGSVKTPTVKIERHNGDVITVPQSNYIVSYQEGRINVGRYKVTITFTEDFEGKVTKGGTIVKYFNIIPKNVTGISKLTARADGFTVYWNPQKTQTSGYEIQYSTSSNFSGAKTIVMPKNTYSAKKITGLAKNKKYYVRIRTYKVTKFNGKDYNIYSGWSAAKTVSTITTTAKLSTTSTYYNGSVKIPTVTVKDSTGKTLKQGTDYTVSYASGRKLVGRYAVKITYKGNYVNNPAQTLYFNIVPKNVAGIKKLTAASKGFTVSWDPQKTQTTGYQIQYSTASNFKNANTITMGKNIYSAKKVTGRLANKKYYVRIRTYKTTKFNGKNYNIYSPWSDAKSVTTKK